MTNRRRTRPRPDEDLQSVGMHERGAIRRRAALATALRELQQAVNGLADDE